MSVSVLYRGIVPDDEFVTQLKISIAIMQYNNDFWKKVRREAKPIISHAIVVISLEFALLIIGILTLALEHIFPKHESYFSLIEKIDIYIALLLLCMFGIYTLLIVVLDFIEDYVKSFLYQKIGKEVDNR